MNGYERYMAMARGEAVDHLPRLPILMEFAAQFIGSNYGAFASDHRVLVEANIRCAERFDFDQVSAISDPYREAAGFGAAIEFVENGVPRCEHPPLADSTDLALLATPDPATGRMGDRVRGVEEMRRRASHDLSVLGWIEGPAAEAADLRGAENFLMDLVMDPGFIADLMDRCVDVGIAFARAQVEAGADTIGIGDAIASQVSPDVFGACIFEREKRLVDAIHEMGALTRLHICGNTTHLLPWFARLGSDVVDLDWQVDMAEARSILGPDTALMGNLDPVEVLMRQTPEDIRSAVRGIYAAIGNRYMVGAGCEAPAATPHENLEALCTPVLYAA